MKKVQLPFIPSFEEGEIVPVQYRNPHEWVESSFINPQESQTEFMGRTVTDQRLTVLYWLMAAVVIVFVGRSAYLQLYRGSGYALLAERNKTRVITTQAHRGIFFDKNGIILVRNSPDFSLVITPVDLSVDEEEKHYYLSTLSHYLHRSMEDITTDIQRHDKYRPFLLADHIVYSDALQIEVTLRDSTGIQVAVSEKRSYETTPEQSMAHIVGYTGRINEGEFQKNSDEYTLVDTIGKNGLELGYESTLRGVAGKKEIEVDALGHEKGIISEREGQGGSNLILSLDFKVQKKAEEILAMVMRKFGKKKGVVIVSDPRNGEIVAYVSLPSYNANLFSQGISQNMYDILLKDEAKPLLNRGTMGEYPSGSTIKMLVAAAALQEHIITRSTAVVSTGGIHVGEWFFPDWKTGGHGVTNVIKALAESVNTFFYIIGGGYQQHQGLGIDRLVSYFKKFGIGEETHIDFQKERNGFLPSPEWKLQARHEPWYIGDTYHVAIGQGDILVTPLQVNLYTSYFAQNGVNYQPHIVHAIESSTKKNTRVDVQSKIYKKDIVDSQTTAIVREGLRAGVTQGSSRRLLSLPVTSAGKTGTAQWSSTKSPHAWFTGWAPYENPEVVFTVLIEEGEEGSRTAISVAYDLLNWYFSEYKKK